MRKNLFKLLLLAAVLVMGAGEIEATNYFKIRVKAIYTGGASGAHMYAGLWSNWRTNFPAEADRPLDEFTTGVLSSSGNPDVELVTSAIEGVDFLGWYKDEACTILASGSLEYNAYGSSSGIAVSTDEASAPTTTFYAKYAKSSVVWSDYAEAPVAGGKYYLYSAGFNALAGLYTYSDGKVVRGYKDANQAVLFTVSDATNPQISCVDEGVTKYVNKNGTYIETTAPAAKTLVLKSDGSYMINLNNGHSSGYTWWEMQNSTYSPGSCTNSTINESSATERWRFIPEAAYNALCTVESLNESGSITIDAAPTASGSTTVKFNVSEVGPVDKYEYTIENNDGNFVLGTPTRDDQVITVPVTYTAQNVHSGTSTPIATATVRMTAKNTEASTAAGQVPVYVNLYPQFALNVAALDWSYTGETLVETYYAGMEVAASQRERLQDKLIYNPAQTTGVAANHATWTATIVGTDAAQFKFANGTRTVSGPYTPELLDVIFAPSATGEFSAILHVEASYTDANSTVLTHTQDIALRGKGENVSIITLEANSDQSPSDDEHYSYGEIIGTNSKNVSVDLFMVGVTGATKVWSDPDGVFEFDASTIDLNKVNQTLTFRAHRTTPATEATDHTATLTISGTGSEGPISAVLTLIYRAMPLLTPEVTWNWEHITENSANTDPLSTTSDGAWTLTKLTGDKVSYDTESKTATVPYLHHEPATATFAFSIAQTNTYAAMNETYTATVSPYPVEMHLTTMEQFNDPTFMSHTSWESFDESKHEMYVDYSDNVYFFVNGHSKMSFSYHDKGTTTWKITEFYSDNSSQVVYNGLSFSEGYNEVSFNPTTVKLSLYGSGSGAYFTDVRFSDNDTITADYDKVVLINDNGTIYDLDVTATFTNTYSATVALNAAAQPYFELRTAGKASGASIVFDSNDLGLGTVKDKVITIALKDGADAAAAAAATAGNACQVTFGDNYTYNHHEFSLPLTLVDAYNVTFKHHAHGSYTVTYEDDTEHPQTVSAADYVKRMTSIAPEHTTVTISAPTAASGYAFQGWKINDVLVSCKSSMTKSFDEATTIEPVFGVSDGTFKIDDALFNELSEALGVAGAVADQKPVVVLMKDLALATPATYTIPAGVTLLIPYKAGFNELQDQPEVTTTATALSAYRTLTLKEGVNIICNGNICVSGKIMAAGGGNKSAYTTGDCGVINMANGGHIELNDGAELFCWGYIKGQDMDQGNNTQDVGTVTVNAGAIVHENFELGDWRGGTATSNIYFEKDEKMLFPFQSYALQNVEIPTTYKYGSKLEPYMVVHTGYGDIPFVVAIIGSEETLFLLKDEESVVRKWYDPTTDLSCYELSGTAQLDQLILSLPFVGDFESGDCNLPISNSMHILLANCNMTLSKPLTVQAGAVVEIKNTATVNLTAKIHMFDVDQWDKFVHNYYFRSFNNLTSHKDRGAENSKAGLDDAKFIIDGTLNVISGQGYIYSTAGGANVMGNGGGKITFKGALPADDEIWQVYVLSGSPYITWVSIPEAAANLCNEDGSYTRSIGGATFYNLHGRWFHEEDKDEQSDHTYWFTYMENGNSGEDVGTAAVYSHDKTGLEARMKWFNVEEDGNCDDWWIGANDYRYNYTKNSDWHQFIQTQDDEHVYSGSDNKLYQKDECSWAETGAVDENCLYTFYEGGQKVKKALVDGHFIPLTSNGYDPAYHKTDDASKYYICFTGCNWHEATPYEGEQKAYTINPETDVYLHYIWFNNNWLNVEREEPYFYTADEQTNVKTYYEYVDGEWLVATPFIRVTDALETREFYMVKEALNVAALKKNATITVLRDAHADLTAYTFNAVNTNCTLDLNSHILDITVTGSGTTEVKMFAINMGTGTFTITDNSEHKIGEFRLHANPSTATQSKRWHGIYLTAGELVINAGKVYVEDLFTYTSTSNAGIVSGITIAAGQKFTLNDGGEVEAKATYATYGVHMAASTTTTGKTYINGGTITASTTNTTSTIGLYIGSGTAYVSGGTINATTKTTTARGIYVEGHASNYIGHLEMTGGTINAKATTTTAIGIYVGGNYTFNATKPNTIKATFRGVANISGGTINVDALGTTTAYGVNSFGTTTITGGTFNVKTKTTTCEGLLVQDGTTTISGSAVFNVTATTNTAYGIYAYATTPADKTGRPYKPVVIVNGGTFNVSTLGTTTGYGILVSGATRAITNTGSGYYAGNYASEGMVTVNDGTFNVTTKTKTCYVVVVNAAATQAGATDYDPVTATPRCTINGGHFKTAGASGNYAANDKAATDALCILGGYYTHTANLAKYANPQGRVVVTLPKTDPNYPDYKYEVAPGYTITFMNGETSLQSNNQKAGTAAIYSGAEPTKANTETNSYQFDGWSLTDGGAVAYAKGAALPEVTADATYYAHFNETALKYRVKFDPRSGVASEEYRYITPGAKVGTLPTATRTGYTLKGWYTKTSGGTKITKNTVPAADVTYYAQWTALKFDLTLDMNGGVVTTAGQLGSTPVYWPEVDATGVQTYNVNYNAAIKVPVVERAGYTFKAWSPTPAATMPLENVTYTAQWTPNTNTAYVVKHFKQNLDGTYPDEPEETDELMGTSDTYVTPNTKSYFGYVTPAKQTVQILADGSQVVNYNYALITYTLTLNATANGGKCATASLTVKHGATPTLPEATKENYTFTGWFTKAVGGDQITNETVIQRNIGTLYAQFAEGDPTEEVIIVGNGEKLTISDPDMEADALIVKKDGIATFTTGALTVERLILESTGSQSGQLVGVNASKLTVTEEVFFDFIPNGEAGTQARTWYAIAVPWAVNAEEGIFWKEGNRHLTIGRDFDLIYYDVAQRAAEGDNPRCWKYVQHDEDKIMHPGQMYMMYFDPGWKTIRFKAANSATALTMETPSVTTHDAATGNDKDANWNGIANPAVYHAYLSAGTTYGQVLNNGSLDNYQHNEGSPIYSTVSLSSYKFVVGKPVYVQATGAQSVVINPAISPSLAPRRVRAAGVPEGAESVYQLTIAAEDRPSTDNLFIQTAEQKMENYVIGQDLAKGGVAKNSAQLWVNRYGVKLSVNTAAPVNGVHEYPLGLSIPTAGDYTIAIESTLGDTEDLYLTRDGEAIWNLSNGAYTGSFEKGTLNNYGLRVSAHAPQITTGIDEAVVDAKGETRKVIINDQVFIIRGEKVYSIDGQMVK